MQTAQDAQDDLARAQDAFNAAQDSFYEKVDSVAADLGKSRDEVLDMVEKAADIDADSDDVHPVNTVDNGAGKIAQAEKYAVYSLDYDRGEGLGHGNDQRCTACPRIHAIGTALPWATGAWCSATG